MGGLGAEDFNVGSARQHAAMQQQAPYAALYGYQPRLQEYKLYISSHKNMSGSTV